MLQHRILRGGVAIGLLAAIGFASDGIGNLSLTASSRNPRNGAAVQLALHGAPGAAYTLRSGPPGAAYVPGIGPVDLVMQSSTIVATGTIPSSGFATFLFAAPGSGLSDVVFQGFAASQSSPTGTAVSNPERAEVGAPPTLSFFGAAGFLPSMPALNGCRAVCGDVDGDGDIDIYLPTVGNPLSSSMEAPNLLLLNDGSGHFANASATNLPGVREATNRAILVDIDGDFDLDIVTGNGKKSLLSPTPTASRVYRNDGTGHFAYVAPLPGAQDYVMDVAAGDVDGDGDVDLVLGCDGYSTGMPERLLINDGSGTFAAASGGTSSPTHGNGNGNGNGGGGSASSGAGITAVSDRTLSVKLADFDGDGDVDLLSGNCDAGGARFYRNNGAGSFQAEAGAFAGGEAAWAYDLAVGDLDADGDVDSVIVTQPLVGDPTTEVRVLLNSGNGSFTRLAGAVSGVPAGEWFYDVALGDLDGDGDLDALVVGSSAFDWLLINDGTGRLTSAAVGVPAPVQARQPVLFDANGDNVLDAVYSLSAGYGTATLQLR